MSTSTDLGDGSTGQGLTGRRGAGAALPAVIVFMFGSGAGCRPQAVLGAAALFLVAACSSNARAVDWRTAAWGIGRGCSLAVYILWLETGGEQPRYASFGAICRGVARLLDSNACVTSMLLP